MSNDELIILIDTIYSEIAKFLLEYISEEKYEEDKFKEKVNYLDESFEKLLSAINMPEHKEFAKEFAEELSELFFNFDNLKSTC
jgi:hypothetical protein